MLYIKQYSSISKYIKTQRIRGHSLKAEANSILCSRRGSFRFAFSVGFFSFLHKIIFNLFRNECFNNFIYEHMQGWHENRMLCVCVYIKTNCALRKLVLCNLPFSLFCYGAIP